MTPMPGAATATALHGMVLLIVVGTARGAGAAPARLVVTHGARVALAGRSDRKDGAVPPGDTAGGNAAGSGESNLG